ncbi:MarR family winged helix-turn-helix transcriptional regulator [Capillimicrobium parvum]|uniref:HTH-type transcriptional regulator n=1 Tax=Capillimicrobium parvum TaxID=2884022 RepID=A0A9E6Y001_9ACTN|nr:MarR family transcriptional regulator [Capillimicrobium parvum]UGS36906.1 putative HTH-type transcriptional regulator [Capillimicrobium parvum]
MPATPPVSAEATPSLVYVVGRVNQGVRRELRKALAPWGLSVPELTALSVLRARPGLSNAQLSRRSLMTPQSMNDVVAELERRGLVERTVDPSHARILRTRLTHAGEELLAQVDPVVGALQDEMLADVPPEHREIVLDGLISCMRTLRAR